MHCPLWKHLTNAISRDTVERYFKYVQNKMVALYYSLIVYISILILDSPLKSSAQILTDGKHKFLDCNIPFTEWDMDKMRAVRFSSPFFGRHPHVQYPHTYSCSWSFKGTDTCQPEMYCDRDIHLRDFGDRHCEKEHLKIEDGAGGLSQFCGHVRGKDVRLRPLRGKNLQVTFVTHTNPDFDHEYSGFSCTVTCNGVNGSVPLNSTDHPTSTTPSPSPSTSTPSPSTPSPPSCVCGTGNEMISRRKRLIGGTAVYSPHPWIVAILNKSTNFPICGGTVLSSQHVLTSASCLRIGHTRIGPDDIVVVMEAMVLDSPYESDDLGQFSYIPRLEREQPDPSMPRFSVEGILIHPSYASLTLSNDAAILRLSTKINLDGEKATTVCLPEPSSSDNFDTTVKQLEAKQATLMGYGFASESSMLGYRLLHQIDIPILPQAQCREMYRLFQFSEKLICAGTLDDTTLDGCEGDSGDALVTKSETDQFTQVGIHSFGLGCVQKRYTGTYTLVSDIVDWINGAITGAQTCTKDPPPQDSDSD